MTKAIVVGGFVLALLVPEEAAGQQGAGGLRQLAGHLGPGDGVYVRVTNGSRIKADVSQMGPDSLTLSNGLTLAEEDILSIELQDSLWEGAAIGLGVGAALLATRPVGSDSAAAVVSGVALLLAAPAAIGACVDGSFHRMIYAGTRTVHLSPTVTRGGFGARLSVGW